MQYLFLDTNIFMHFQDYEQIPWKEFVDSTEDLVLVVAPVVIQELDKHKRNPNSKLAMRARKLLHKIEDSLDKENGANLKVLTIDKTPSEETFHVNALQRSEQDDRLIASMLEFQQGKDREDRVILVSDDLGIRLKLRRFPIKQLQLPENLLLPNQRSEEEALISAMKKEILDLKSRIPVVSLTFEDGTLFKTFARDKPLRDRDEVVSQLLTKQKQTYPYLGFTARYENQPTSFLQDFISLSKAQVDDYNDQLRTYFSEFERYLLTEYERASVSRNSIRISLLLSNTGTEPANDLDIALHFPDGFELLDDLPNKAKEPSLPYLPTSRYDRNALRLHVPNLNFGGFQREPILNSIDPSRPVIKRTNSYDVTFDLKNLKHGMRFNVQPLYVKYVDISDASGFAIEFKLHIGNVPKPVTGALNVKIEDKI
jgi:predicted nucleic acid-binding protein